jgi:GT2 family glycosyltransferase
MSPAPRFSVVVPTCDRPALLAACLERLAPGAQELPAADYEVLVSDDGRHSVAALVQRQFAWARWTRGPQAGPAANRNHGAALARGAWLAFTDDDCQPQPDWLAAFAAAIQASPSTEVWEGRTFCREANPGPLRFAPVNESGGRLWACNFAIRRERFLAVGGFDAGFPQAHLEDVDLQLRLRRAAAELRFCPAAAVEHPPRPVGPVRRQAQAHASYFHFARKHRATLAQAGLSPRAFARWRVGQLRSSRSPLEALRYLARCAAEIGWLLPLLTIWWITGRHRP